METRNCQNCKSDFVIDQDDFGFYAKMKVPLPTFCPECRLQRRLAWRNERSLHPRECGLCKKKIVSIYNNDLNKPVYCDVCWWSDNWDASIYAKDYDFTRPFLEQFFELYNAVPAPNLYTFSSTMVNSPYCNMANNMKNCFFVYDGTFAEDVSYSSGVFHSKNSMDITMARKAELCYETVTTINCYKTIFSQNCEDCVDVACSHGLRGCNNCFGCVNLHKKSYYIFNVPYTKDEYEKKIKSLALDSYKNVVAMRKKTQEFWKMFPKRFMFGVQNVNITGDYMEHSKNVRNCFGVANVEDSKFCSFVSNGPTRTVYDFTHFGDNIELVYECLQCGDGLSQCKFGWGNWSNTNNAQYCITVPGSSYIFGCVGMKKKKYCILNKEYTKEEYEALIPKIIEHMNTVPYLGKEGRIYKYGEFFPVELSPFGYNETTAQEYFSLTEETAKQKGYNWRNSQERNYQITKQPEELPDSIIAVDDSILSEVIACEHHGKCDEGCMTAFKIMPEDLKFYRRMNLPLPRQCSNCRRFKRVKQRNPLKLWHRKCMNNGCTNEFETSYSPDRPEIVYCESCYQQEVV